MLLLCPAPRATAQTNTVVKVYACAPGTAPATADRLRAEFALAPGVRIAADARTSQVVVQAPPEIQARVSQRLAVLPSSGSASPDAAQGLPAGSATPSAVPQPAPRSALPAPFPQGNTAGATADNVPLRHLQIEQFEAALWSVMGRRLSALPPPTPQARRFRLALAGGSAVDLTLEPPAARVSLEGHAAAVEACRRLIRAIDRPQESGGHSTRLISLQAARPESVQRAVAAVGAGSPAAQPGAAMVANLFQAQPRPAAAAPGPPVVPVPAPPAGPAAAPEDRPAAKDAAGLVSPVQIEMLPGLDVLVIRGNRHDVDQVVEIINQIERLSTETEPSVEVFSLQHVDSQAVGALIRTLYDEVYLLRQGYVSITPLVKPNALLVVGRQENVQTVAELVRRLDEPVAPDTQFRVFHLRHAAAATVQTTILEFFAERGGLGPLVRSSIDARSNALIVQASPRDMAEVAELVRRLDTPNSAAVNELRVIQLEHTLAQDVATVLQSAIGAAAAGGAARPIPGAPAPAAPGAAARPGADQRTVMLRFLTVDAKGQRLLNSGILSDVRVTADTRANALVISAPAECIELIEALVRHLDKLPAAEAQVKVFTIVNGDAASLVEMLRALFASQVMAGQPMLQTAAGTDESSLVALRFAVDMRTNSIIASGSMGDLNVVEAILMRLDDSDVRHRRSVVFRLKNSPATDVAIAINEFLRSERQVQQLTPGLTSPFEQIEHEVVVVPEPVSNSLILSATPRFFEEVRGLIEQLDARPPMVMIQVLIAEVQLGDTDEFGIELGLQDAILFDRSILSDIEKLTTTTYDEDGDPLTTQETIVSSNSKPGFAFNNQPLGNSVTTNRNSRKVGTQGISSFSVGRVNGPLGFGGLVLSASSESVSILLRALNECHRVDVLQRPQVMTLDNQPAFIQVGQRVPRIIGTQVNQIGQTNSITLENVGLILGVTPRISPDGLVVLEIDAEKSELGPEAEGIPVAISEGEVIRSPRINTTTAQTTVSALSGQTVILGGLITRNKNQFHRKVPFLGDVPLLGRLFRFDSVSSQRNELLIIMTPHIVRTEADADAIRRAESARMNWCMCDVVDLYGEAGLRRRTDEWSDAEVPVVYPDTHPKPASRAPQGAPAGSEVIPTPSGIPQGNPFPPAPGPPAASPAASPAAGTQLRFLGPAPGQSTPPVDPGAVQPAMYQPPAFAPPPMVQQPVYHQPLPAMPQAAYR